MDHLGNAEKSLLELIQLEPRVWFGLGTWGDDWSCNWKTFFIIFLCNWDIGCQVWCVRSHSQRWKRLNIPQHLVDLRNSWNQYWNLSYCIYTGTYRYQRPSNRNHVLYIIQFQYPSHSLYSVTVIVIVMSVMFTDIRREHHRSLRHGKLDHISLMEILYADDTLLIPKNARAMNRLLHAVEDDSQYYGLIYIYISYVIESL